MLDSLVTGRKRVIIYLHSRSDAGHCSSCNDPSVILWEMDCNEQKVHLTDFIPKFIAKLPQMAPMGSEFRKHHGASVETPRASVVFHA